MGFRAGLGVVLLTLVPLRGAAVDTPMSVEVRPAGPLVAGARADLLIDAALPEGAPALVTVRALGEAVEVLRGRLLGKDAKRQPNGQLRFEVPLRARTAGSTELRVMLDGYVCDPRCRDAHAEVRVVLDVRAL